MDNLLKLTQYFDIIEKKIHGEDMERTTCKRNCFWTKKFNKKARAAFQLRQHVKFAWTSRSNSRASVGPYRMFVYQSIICLITNLQLKFLSQMTQKIKCIRSINNIHWQLLDFFSFKLLFSLKSKKSSTAWKISSHFVDVKKYFIFYNIAINTRIIFSK